MELWAQSATELAHQIARRKVSSAAVVEAHLQRIAVINPSVNAIVRVLADEALTAAKAADASLADGEMAGPLHGVPFTVKDNIDVAGQPTSWGVAAFQNSIASEDAPAVARMKAAGAILIGRTNLPDMALRAHTDSSLYGLTRNPWNLAHTAGGSSGGEAAALASGMSPLGLGTDIGGSLRNPATACGIASIRPSAGRVPDAGDIPTPDRFVAEQLMNVQGPMARRIGDVRLALQVIMGAHARDPWSVDVPFSAEASRPCHVAVMAEPPGGSTAPVVAATVRRAADALANAGYDVREVAPPRFEETCLAWARLIGMDFSTVLPVIVAIMGPDAIKALAATNTAGDEPPSFEAFSRLLVLRHSLGRDWATFFQSHPLLLSPTWTALPFVHGFDSASAENGRETISMIRPVLPANLLGLPSVCVPAGRDEAANLPIGVLLTGWRYDDARCLDAGEAIEVALGLSTPVDPR